jgi:hypothetical protein
MTHYCITDWDINYEVNKDNRSWKPGQAFREGPIPEIRVKARRDWNHRFVMLNRLIGEESWAALGMFEKLCQIVACEWRPQRVGGIIRYSDGQPATVEQIARMFCVNVERIQSILDALSHPHVCWVTQVSQISVDFCETRQSLPTSPKSEKIPNQDSRVEDSTEEIQSKGIDTTGGPEPEPPSPPKQDLDDFFSEKFRRDYRMKLGKVLHAKTNSDVQAISNFERWLQGNVTSGRAGPQVYRRALETALDCVKGKNRLAVFWSRVAAEMGYDSLTNQMTRGP